VTAAVDSSTDGVTEGAPGTTLLGRSARDSTRVSRRLAALAAYVVLLFAWSRFAHAIGLPENPLNVSVWIWFATIAWNIEAPRRQQLVFLRDWWPPMLGLTIYWFTRGYTDDLGIPVHVSMPIRFDTWFAQLLGANGGTPTELLQQHWCALPCTVDVPAHWYDTFFSLVYSTHFVTGLSVAGFLWLRHREEFHPFMRRYVTINYCALAIYFLYPMAPPWLAAQEGRLPSSVHRLTGRGLGQQVSGHISTTLTGLSNPTAAMPSLHTGVATLIALYGVWRLSSPYRWLLLLYPLAMGTTLVYFGEHYVVDLLAGVLLAALVMTLMPFYERWRLRAKLRSLRGFPGPRGSGSGHSGS
jgi:membrane-associated phospholipid phosphatase